MSIHTDTAIISLHSYWHCHHFCPFIPTLPLFLSIRTDTAIISVHSYRHCHHFCPAYWGKKISEKHASFWRTTLVVHQDNIISSSSLSGRWACHGEAFIVRPFVRPSLPMLPYQCYWLVPVNLTLALQWPWVTCRGSLELLQITRWAAGSTAISFCNYHIVCHFLAKKKVLQYCHLIISVHSYRHCP